MSDIVERLRKFVTGCDRPECSRMVFTPIVCEEAADEIERLRAALEAWNHAVRIDVLMEGPRYMGVSGEAGRRAWEMTRAALEGR